MKIFVPMLPICCRVHNEKVPALITNQHNSQQIFKGEYIARNRCTCGMAGLSYIRSLRVTCFDCIYIKFPFKLGQTQSTTKSQHKG